MVQKFYGATIEAQRAINELLSLPASGREQDWEIELADPDRINDMLETAMNADLSYDERCALALITIASIEELAESGEIAPEIISQAVSTIGRHRNVRDAMAFYWIDQHRASHENIVRKLILG